MESEINEKEDEKSEINNKDIVEKFKIDDLINSVFKDKSKKPEIIQKLRPFFSLKVTLSFAIIPGNSLVMLSISIT